jgi:hypothetical protein
MEKIKNQQGPNLEVWKIGKKASETTKFLQKTFSQFQGQQQLSSYQGPRTFYTDIVDHSDPKFITDPP